MEITPNKIYQEFERKNLDKNTAIDYLFSFIENSDDLAIRIEGIKTFLRIKAKEDRIFKFLENLFISDSNWEIRNAAVLVIKEIFLEKVIDLLKWAMNHEYSYECIRTIIEILVDLNNEDSKSFLIEEIQKIRKNRYLVENKKYTNKGFKRDLKKLFKIKKINGFSSRELADILLNYKTVTALKKKFFSVYYELEDALVIKLDLSDVEYEVRGWKAEFKNNIHDLNDITGLKNLKHLKSLYLDNNQIQNIKSLIELDNLTDLYLSNNQIADLENLNYIKILSDKGLKYLDLCGNELAGKIDKKNINPELKLKLTKSYFF